MLIYAAALCTLTSASERLDIYPAGGGQLATLFQFEQSFELTKQAAQLFASLSSLQELRMAMVRGRWHYDAWGEAPIPLASQGIQVETVPSLNPSEWEQLTQSLAGLFCGSINLLADGRDTVISPRLGGRVGILPRETVCTENLTPFAKLLPCQTSSGLASLLNPLRLFAAPFTMLEVTVKREEGDWLHLRQRVLASFEVGGNSWTVTSLLERDLHWSCPALEASSVFIHLPPVADQGWSFTKPPLNDNFTEERVAKFAADSGVGMNRQRPGLSALPRPSVRLLRHLAGVGQERGHLRLVWENTANHPNLITHTEMLPWYLRLYIHTLQCSAQLEWFHYAPAIDRKQSALLEFSLLLPPKATITLTIEFEKSLLKYTEYPVDPNRGLDLPAALWTYTGPDHHTVHMTTPILLLTMPVPDFTMPYNVITLTSTLIGIFFGFTFKALSSSFYLGKRPASGFNLRRLFSLIRSKLKRE